MRTIMEELIIPLSIMLLFVCLIAIVVGMAGAQINRTNTAPTTDTAPYVIVAPIEGAVLFKEYKVDDNIIIISTHWKYLNDNPFNSFFGNWVYVDKELTLKLRPHAKGIESRDIRENNEDTLNSY